MLFIPKSDGESQVKYCNIIGRGKNESNVEISIQQGSKNNALNNDVFFFFNFCSDDYYFIGPFYFKLIIM